MTTSLRHLDLTARSPFAGQLVHELLRFEVGPSGPRPRFDDDVWDLTGILGTPVQVPTCYLRWDFTLIAQPAWRVLLREFFVALRAPDHDLIAQLPSARRAAVSLLTCAHRRSHAIGWLRWLADEGLDTLMQVTQEHCDRWLDQRRRDGLTAAALQNEISMIKDLARYTDLFTTDHFPAGFMPWNGRTAAAVAEYSRPGENLTPPIPDTVMGPALRAGLYLADTIGPRILAPVALLTERRTAAGNRRRAKRDEIDALLDRYRAQRRPLPELDENKVRGRVKAGWDQHDPLLRVNFGELAHDLGICEIPVRDVDRETAEAVLAEVGVAPFWVRDAEPVERADGDGSVPWTEPLTGIQFYWLARIVFHAALFTTSAITGMRSSELMELSSASCLPPQQVGPGLVRYRLASKLIKGQEWGGVRDEWVVIEPAYRAVELAIQLATHLGLTRSSPGLDKSVFGRFTFPSRFDTFRRWVNSPAGIRLGLESIPAGGITCRMTRRTLALEMARRPHGLWATKVHLKQVEVATTEGYTGRPGGAQAQMHAEMKQEERVHKRRLTAAAYRDYQQGRLPAGPGAADLVASFQHVDAALSRHETTQPMVVATDRQIELLLKKRADSLHIQPANYCWFTDPTKALCLKLAGTPTADKPLAGLCDAARCPQATFHAEHRDAWAGCADTTATFLGNPRIPAGEKTRLAAEHDRARRVAAAIDAATGQPENGGRP